MDWLIQSSAARPHRRLPDKMVLQRLKEAAEKAKIELSSTMETEINLPSSPPIRPGPKHLVKRLTRGEVRADVRGPVQRALDPTKKCLADAKKSPKEMTRSSWWAADARAKLQQIVKDFSQGPNRSVNPDEVVAIGAAARAASSPAR